MMEGEGANGEEGTGKREKVENRIAAIAETARAWRDPEHPPREQAVQKTLDAPNRFTEEALAFAVNQAMHGCTEDRLAAWRQSAPEPLTTGVLCAGEEAPLGGGFRALLAVLLAGHRCVIAAPDDSPHLLPAFAADFKERAPELHVHFTDENTVFEQAGALVGPERGGDTAARCEEHDLPASRRWLHARDGSVAVLDGSESEDEREGLAEDAWLYDGYGAASVRVVWAPQDLSPDPYLEAMAQFRGVFPAHDDTPGALAMQRAMLEARDQAHAYADGLVFLMSKGEPEAQLPGHLRWAEYDGPAQVERWIRERGDTIYQVSAREQLADRLELGRPVWPLGAAHRVPVGDGPPGEDLMRFLAALGA
ncbi:MAG: hypothetical protein BRD45_04415 [Bacteroidetes bacterium QS_8_64_10]|nr:MAG: hypothetical protein BRD45_04415 [Bacteroidetes bacterium QS_8_64_10]